MRERRLFLASITALLLVLISLSSVFAANESLQASGADSAPSANYICAVYFTGAGCPHCAKAKPVIEKIANETPNLVLIRYEVQQERLNAPVIQGYAERYGVKAAIPLIIFGDGNYLQGDSPIIDNLKTTVDSMSSNPCPLIDGSAVDFEKIKIGELPGRPEILTCGGAPVNGSCTDINGTVDGNGTIQPKTELTLTKIITLSLTDAINPCVFAILIWILVAILTKNPGQKKKALQAGLAFALAVFVIYFFYGIAIVVFFQAIQALMSIKVYLYKAMAILAICLGILNIRDFISYRPGRAGTEMPLMFRPRVKHIISRVTSPAGAFVAGVFVTVFLLPCTIGPYIIAGGILSSMQLLNTVPWLLFYNLIFILPLIAVTLIVSWGVSSVDSVSGWKDKNIRRIHLSEGILTLALGLAMLFGWI